MSKIKSGDMVVRRWPNLPGKYKLEYCLILEEHSDFYKVFVLNENKIYNMPLENWRASWEVWEV